MSFLLPPDFGRLVNQMGELLRDFEATVDELKRQECLRKALVLACQMLSDVDLPKLEIRIAAVFRSAEVYAPDWFEQVVGDQVHFRHFLYRVESAIIDAAGVDAPTRDRVLREIESLQSAAVKWHASVSPSMILNGIKALRNDVCSAKSQVIARAAQLAMHTKIVKVLCVIAILTNAAAAAVSLVGSPAAFATSIVVGGTRFIPAP